MLSHNHLRELCEAVYHESHGEVAGIEYTVTGNIVCFRGTDEVRDWVTNIRFLPWWNKGIGWCPAGYLKTSYLILIEVLTQLAKEGIPASELVLTGHSLGGAMAMLSGAKLKHAGIPPREIVTFGAPKCGRLKLLDEVTVTQYRNGKDIVPSLPPLMRRHKKPVQIGKPDHRIRDHYIKNYRIPAYYAIADETYQ